MSKRYDSYKDSGVEWIGEIPKHWFCVGTNKVYYDLGTGTTPSSDNSEYYDDNGYYWITTTDLNEGIMFDTLTKITDKSLKDYPNLRLYPSGSIYISMYGGRIGKLGISTFESYCNQSVCVLPNNEKINVKFYYYWYLGFQEFVKNMGRGGGQPNINKDMIKQFPTVKIPLSEQHQIVKYLDTKTSMIDSLIEKTQRKIELLKEKRTSLINEVVTKGLNPNVEMKDSGVEWIGEIPKHWEISRLDYLFNLFGRVGWKSLKSDEYVEDGYVFLSTPNIKGKKIDYTNVNYITKERYFESPEIMLENDDILLVKDGSTLGIVNIVENLPRPTTVNSSIGVLKRKSDKIIPRYMLYLLTSDFLQNVINRIKGGMGVPHLFQSDIKKFQVILPSITEQTSIVRYLDIQNQNIETTISNEERRIELLKEYRQSLISEVVTGKVKVTTDEHTE
jgi:type I restriction enzyme S subunit